MIVPRRLLRSRLWIAGVLALAVAAVGAPHAAFAQGAEPSTASFIVGFKSPGVDAAAISAAGGALQKQSAGLGLAVVEAHAPGFARALLANPNVAFVETNDRSVGGYGAQWDGAHWDGAGWDTTNWDAAGWDAAGWDAAGWDAAGWDAAGWDQTAKDAAGWDAAGWDAAGWDSTSLTEKGTSTLNAARDPLFHRQWGLRAVYASSAWANFTSYSPRTVCVLDSGVDYTHPDLSAAMWKHPTTGQHGHDFVNGDADPMDDAGHGTHVAGIAAATGKSGQGVFGGSPARIMAVKVLAYNGTGMEGDLALGIDWCVANGASVVSMSLGTPEDSPAVKRAVQDAWAKGVVLVASVGNLGNCGCSRFPADYPEVMAIAGLNHTGTPNPFSRVTENVSIAAPGELVVSLLPGNRYAAANGTSQATPFVSAAAALLLDAKPTLTNAQVVDILQRTARDLGPLGKDDHVGHGVLNVNAALREAQAS